MGEIITFSAMLKQRRRAKHLTQAGLASRVWCSASMLRMIESGERCASRQLAELLADRLGVTPDAREAFLQAADACSPPARGTAAVATPAPLAPDLPAYLTPLLGREAEIEAIAARLLNKATPGGARLLTLTGPAGVGKTRLASAVASGVRSRFSDGARFVPLAALHDPAMVISTIAAALGLREQSAHPDRTPLAALKQHLRSKEMLLVLDNMEQVIEAGVSIAALLESCPTVQALVTSREPLHVQGESVFPVSPLALPDLENFPPVEAMSGYSAVALFVECAQRSVPSFALAEGNAREIATICARMDGLPLAIELVAARIKLFSPSVLLAKLEEARGPELFRMLDDGARDVPARHRTLQAAIGWSYDLLSKQEQTLFRRLAVFVGGCTLNAIEAVCAIEGEGGLDTLEGVSSLLDKSLLQRDPDSEGTEEPRFRLLETVREYALAQLEAHGVESAQARRGHAEFFLAMAATIPRAGFGETGILIFSRLDRDHDNLCAALSWAITNRQLDMVAELVRPLARFWHLRGYFGEGRDWVLRVIAAQAVEVSADPARAAQQVELLMWGALFSLNMCDYSAARAGFNECLVLAEPLGIDHILLEARLHLGNVARLQGDYATAVPLYEECVDFSRELGWDMHLANSMWALGTAVGEEGDFERAQQLLEESLALARSIEDMYVVHGATRDLGALLCYQGHYAQAVVKLEESLALAQRAKFRLSSSRTVAALGWAVLGLGHTARAEQLFHESLSLATSTAGHGVPESLEGLAELELARAPAARAVSGLPRAATLLGAAEAVRLGQTTQIVPVRAPLRVRLGDQARARLGEAGYDTAYAVGHGMSLDEAISYGLNSLAAASR